MIKKVPGIILYLKVPSIGFVKTRLISEIISEVQAYELQIEMIKDTLIMLASLSLEFQPIISYYPEHRGKILKDLVNTFEEFLPISFLNKILYVSQQGDTNGLHFKSTFEKLFKVKTISSCIIIAGDTPHLQSSIIYQSISHLQNTNNTSIIGPSQSGGFYIFGISEFIQNLETTFTKMNEFNNLIALCSENFVSIKVLPFVFDVDLPQDALNLYSIYSPLMEYSENIESIHSLAIPRHTIYYLKKCFNPEI